jgi:RNA polymerase sigma-70 factor (ECF subfamily)
MERMEGDAADVAKARSGDNEAFRALVERHSRTVFRLAYRMTGNEEDAEDVVQEAFLKAYRRLDQFEDRANFGSWVYRIAANCAFDVLRGRARQEERFELPDGEGGDPLESAPASEPAADRLVFGVEVQRRVRSAMSRLTHLERSAFVLRHFEQMSIPEIGNTLGMDTNATKHSIFRAVKKMREALEPMVAAGAATRAPEGRRA